MEIKMNTTSGEKKMALITGGSRGIGAALCMAFAKANYRIAFNYVSKRPRAEEVERQVKRYTDCLAIQADVSCSAEVEAMISSVKQRFGRIDVLINNAGVMANSVFTLIPEEDWDRVIAVHLKGTYLCSKFVSLWMIEQRYGVIVQTELMNTFKSQEDKQMLKQIPLRRIGTPEDIADLALFLASDKSKYITGETIRIDGGLSIV